MSDRYNRNIALKAAVLMEIQDVDAITGEALAVQADAFGRRASAREKEYDFVHWAGTTIWGLLENFLETGFITIEGERPIHDWEFATRLVRITESGVQFMRDAIKEAGTLMDLFAAPAA